MTDIQITIEDVELLVGDDIELHEDRVLGKLEPMLQYWMDDNDIACRTFRTELVTEDTNES